MSENIFLAHLLLHGQKETVCCKLFGAVQLSVRRDYESFAVVAENDTVRVRVVKPKQ